MWMWAVVFVVVVTVILVAGWIDRSRGSPGASRSLPGIKGGRPSRGGARIKRELVVIAALLCAVVGMPQTTSAAGSYGAVVEKGIRGCTTDPRSGVVICFQSPSVSSQSRGMFLQAWRAADFHLARWGTGPATLRVRAVSVSAEHLPGSRPVLTYLASADLVIPQLACREDFRFQASDGIVRLESFVSTCRP